MKKTVALLLCFLMLLSLLGCSADTPKTDNGASAEAQSQTGDTKPADEPAEACTPEWAELSARGKIVTDNGTDYAFVTIPALFSEGATQEILDASAGEGGFTAATLNEDGSVTYKLTQQEHKELLASIDEVIDETMQSLVDEEIYTVSNIEPNEDYTVFDVTMDHNEYGEIEEALLSMFGLFGGLHGEFSDHGSDSIKVNYYAPDGSLICSQQSSAE